MNLTYSSSTNLTECIHTDPVNDSINQINNFIPYINEKLDLHSKNTALASKHGFETSNSMSNGVSPISTISTTSSKLDILL